MLTYSQTILAVILANLCDKSNEANDSDISVCHSREDLAWLISLLGASILKFGFVTFLYYHHLIFSFNNISTYIHTKMDEVLILYSNPFTKGSSIKNLKYIFLKHKSRRIQFTELIRSESDCGEDKANASDEIMIFKDINTFKLSSQKSSVKKILGSSSEKKSQPKTINFKRSASLKFEEDTNVQIRTFDNAKINYNPQLQLFKINTACKSVSGINIDKFHDSESNSSDRDHRKIRGSN